MSTLTTPPLSTLLARLFVEAEATDKPLIEAMQKMTPEQRAAMAASNPNPAAAMAKTTNLYLAVTKETGTLCYMLARACQARSIVEFGTSLGVSTLHFAAALKDNGGGCVISSELDPSKAARARENVAAAGLSDFVDIRAGDAQETLARDLPDTIDIVLLDGAKGLYSPIIALLDKRLRIGALVIADNADLVPKYVERMRAPGSGFLSVPCADDVELSMKVD